MIPLPILIPVGVVGYMACGLFTVFLITLRTGEEFFSGDDRGFEYLPFIFWPIALTILILSWVDPLMRWIIHRGGAVKERRITK